MFLVVEDVHWIDVDSWEILSDVAQRTQSMRIFLLETSRSRFGLAEMPDRFPASLQGILLGALPDEESTNLTRALGSDHHFAIPSDVEAWIIRAGEGSPLMLQALVTYWIETRNASGIPPTISILLESRLDRLSPNALRALQTACLLGRFSSLDRIQATLQLPNHELFDALQQLEEANCLFKNDTAFIASHELLGRAAINRLPRLVHLALLITIARTFEADFTRKFSFDMLAEAINYFARAERLDEVARISSEHYHAMIQLPNPKSLLQTFRSFSNVEITELPILGKVRSRLELEVGEYANAISNTIGELKLPDSLNTTSISDVDSLLSAIDSAHRADPVVDRSELAQFVAMVANHANFPFEQRFRAAEIGLVIAANTCDPKVAEQCFNVLSEAEISNELDPQRLLMLYHTIFGEHSTAQKIARHFIQATGPSHSILDAQDHGKAGFTLRICGEHAEARKVFISAYYSLINLGAEKLAQYPAWQIAQMAIDVNEAAEANDWHEKLLALFDEDDEQVSTNFINAHSCRYEIFRGNAVAANDFLQRTTASLPRFPTIKASAYVIALEIATKLLDESWIPDEVLLSAARNRYRSTAKYGTTDFLAGTICHCLERLGRKQEAIQFLDQYLKEDRREIGPLSAYLNSSKDRLYS
jgi:hypothetical protein